MPLPTMLRDWLVCPRCHQPLLYFEAASFLLCARDRLRFQIENNVPVLLVDEAVELTGAEADRWLNLAKEQGLTGV